MKYNYYCNDYSRYARFWTMKHVFIFKLICTSWHSLHYESTLNILNIDYYHITHSEHWLRSRCTFWTLITITLYILNIDYNHIIHSEHWLRSHYTFWTLITIMFWTLITITLYILSTLITIYSMIRKLWEAVTFARWQV